MSHDGGTTRAVRAIDNQIRLIDEHLGSRAKDEAHLPAHLRAHKEACRRAAGRITTAELVQQRVELEREREELLADREDFARESDDHGRLSLEERLDRAEYLLACEGE